MVELFEEVGLAAGTANLVVGNGPEVGAIFAESEMVDMITFTGSTKTGQSIAKAAIGNLKKVGLELGGKSPNIVFSDCDFEGAIEWAMVGPQIIPSFKLLYKEVGALLLLWTTAG